MTQINILYEDADIIVCHKPAGVATQTKQLGRQDMESLLRNHRAQSGEAPYIGVVHRLDQPVEGVMVFAKNQNASSELSRQVRERQIGKYYYAVVTLPQVSGGIPQADTLTDYMVWNPKGNVAQIVEPQTAKSVRAKKAVLDYRILAVKGSHALLDITLHTGRHHQIRVQLAHLGCPILGERKYGRVDPGSSGLALCSYRLQFVHPATRRQMDFSIEPENPDIATLLT